MRVFDGTASPTPAPLCPGMVTGFQIVDLTDPSATPFPLEDGMTVPLSQIPKSFTVQALADDSAGQVKFYLDGSHVHADSSAPFYINGANELDQLFMEGTYTLSAYTDTETEDDACAISVTIDYANPVGTCEGLITKFALYDTTTQAVVPGYEALADGQSLDLTYLPDHLSIIAFSNGRGGNTVKFWVDGDEAVFHEVTGEKLAITGDGTHVPEWTMLRTTGSYTIKAKMESRLGSMEDASCEITVHVASDWICHYDIQGFSLIDATTDEVIPGYEHMAGNRAIDLADLPPLLALRINKIGDDSKKENRGAQLWVKEAGWDSDEKRTENWPPYASNGDKNGDYNPDGRFTKPGVYEIEARGKVDGSWESRSSKSCKLQLTITDTSYEQGGSIPPETILRIIDNDDGPCAPKLVTPITAGNYRYMKTPVEVVDMRPDDVVMFKVHNYIRESPLDWITTSFVTDSGIEVCDKVENVAFEDFTGHVYEAKCHEGFAYADVFAYSSDFDANQASADTTLLPDACKNPFEGKVVRYTFVFSCNCDTTPEVPDVLVGGVPQEEMTCAGNTANSWGDPHMVPYDGGQYGKQKIVYSSVREKRKAPLNLHLINGFQSARALENLYFHELF